MKQTSSLKIYFAGSIRGGRDMADQYQELIYWLRNTGYVYTEHVGDENALRKDEESLNDTGIHDRDMDWIVKSDIMIAEVSVPSLGVGYEIATAIHLGKPVLSLYNENSNHRLSAMISGSNKIQLVRYNSIEEARSAIKKFIARLGNLT